MVTPISLPATNGLDILDIHDLKIQTGWTGIIIAWVTTQAILVTIIHRPTAHSDLAVPNPQIWKPSHPHLGVRIGVTDVIDHIGMTVVMNLEKMTGIVTKDDVLSGDVMETPPTLRVQKMMTV